jgi:2-aminomuconate deaminase
MEFKSGKAPEPVGLYPHGRRAGSFLFLSGHSVFKNVKIILEEAGAQWKDLVDVTVYLTDMKNDFPIYNRLWAEYFPEGKVCRTTVEVNALPTPISIELKCVAHLEAK